ncbi:HAD family phosphatase [Candidatus Woesearchaeota archaeon]|nr:HAD family phosphatase [Candidatus Woesearchaeota archaeon]
MIKAILFDRDGVILDSEHTNIAAATKTFKELGIEITKEDVQQIIAKHPKDYLTYFHSKYKFSEEDFIKKGMKNYLDMLEHVKFFEKTVELVKKLKQEGYKTGLVTSSDRNNTLEIIEKAGLEKYFETIVTLDEVNNRKPHPEPYFLAAKNLNVKPEECLVIEDSQQGVESAKAAGMKCIAAPTEHTEHQDFSKADKKVKKHELTLKLIKQFE